MDSERASELTTEEERRPGKEGKQIREKVVVELAGWLNEPSSARVAII